MSAQERVAQLLETTRSLSGDAWLTANYTDDGISRGLAFQTRRVITVPQTTPYKCVLDFSLLPSNKAVFVLPLHMAATGGPVLVSTYAISAYSNGTQLPSNPLNYYNKKVAYGVAKHGVTSSGTAGDDLREYIIGSDGTPAAVRSGNATGAVPIVFPPGVILCLEIVNSYSGDVKFALDVVWFELTFGP